MVKRMPAKRICEAASPVAMPKSGLPILIMGKAEPHSAQLMSAPRTNPGVVAKKFFEAGLSAAGFPLVPPSGLPAFAVGCSVRVSSLAMRVP